MNSPLTMFSIAHKISTSITSFLCFFIILITIPAGANEPVVYDSSEDCSSLNTYLTTYDYTHFLNAVAASDTHSLYDKTMMKGSILRLGLPGFYRYEIFSHEVNVPICFINLKDVNYFIKWCYHGKQIDEVTNGVLESEIDNSSLINIQSCKNIDLELKGNRSTLGYQIKYPFLKQEQAAQEDSSSWEDIKAFCGIVIIGVILSKSYACMYQRDNPSPSAPPYEFPSPSAPPRDWYDYPGIP